MNRLLFLLLTTSVLGVNTTSASTLDLESASHEVAASPFNTYEGLTRLVKHQLEGTDRDFLCRLGYDSNDTLDFLLTALFFDSRVVSEEFTQSPEFEDTLEQSRDHANLLQQLLVFHKRPRNLNSMIRKLTRNSSESAFRLFQKFQGNPAINEEDRLQSAFIFADPNTPQNKRDYAAMVINDIVTHTSSSQTLSDCIDFFRTVKDRENIRLACLRVPELTEDNNLPWSVDILVENGFIKDAANQHLNALKHLAITNYNYPRSLKECLKIISENPGLTEERDRFKNLLCEHLNKFPSSKTNIQLYLDAFITLGYIEEFIAAFDLAEGHPDLDKYADRLASLEHPKAAEIAMKFYLRRSEAVYYFDSLQKLASKIISLNISEEEKGNALATLYTSRVNLIITLEDAEFMAKQLRKFNKKTEAAQICRDYIQSQKDLPFIKLDNLITRLQPYLGTLNAFLISVLKNSEARIPLLENNRLTMIYRLIELGDANGARQRILSLIRKTTKPLGDTLKLLDNYPTLFNTDEEKASLRDTILTRYMPKK